ncbi:MAG TPA: TlpA disulfide reductase family protein [Chitinophagaceae bacterium]|jgi:peroxiredoxin
MVKYLLPALIFSAFVAGAKAQSTCSTFTLTGTINTDTGEMHLISLDTDSYYPNNACSQETKIEKGSFTFRGPILYPYAARLGLKINAQWKYMSDIFFIDPCAQAVTCNIDSTWEIPGISNKSMLELSNRYLPSYNEINNKSRLLDQKRDSLAKVYKKTVPAGYSTEISVERKRIDTEAQMILWQYAETNPSSFVALWELIRRFHNNNYRPIYDSIYNQFSASIKETYTGRELARRLDSSKLTADRPFPQLMLLNRYNTKEAFLNPNHLPKYTLIDFWFSHCGPCLAQFKRYKEIYTTYKPLGFQIIGISTDSRENIKSWKAVIKRFGLTWKQYLDEAGEQASKLFINSFPANFLVNEKGIIIKRNITQDELVSILSQLK